MRRRRLHRQYGLSNANQVLLALVVCALLFLALLRRHWLNVDAGDAAAVSAGLWRLYVSTATGTQSTSWTDFCAGNRSLPMPSGEPQPLSDVETQLLCAPLATGALVPTAARAAISAAIGLVALCVAAAIYLHFGAPSREQVFWVGTLPALSLLLAAVLGTAVLIIWQARLGPFDNGDCFGILVAATVIAYAVAVSMAIRWRWPGVCAVPNEQQALGARANTDALLVFRPRDRRQRRRQRGGSASAAPAADPRAADAFHQLA